MITAGSVNLLAAESGTGKTWLALALAGAVARGVPFAGHAVKQMQVLYIDGENPVGVVKNRLELLAIPEAKGFYIWGGWWLRQPPFGPGDPRAIEFAERCKGLMIFDSFIEFHTGDESNASETREYMKHFRNLANLGATVLILHNSGKAGTARKYRGSSDIKAAVDTAYTVEQQAGSAGRKGLDRLRVKSFKARHAEGRDFTLQFVANEGFRDLDEATRDSPTLDTASLRSLLGPVPINGTEFKRRAQMKGIPRDAADSFLKEGSSEEIVGDLWLRQFAK